MRSPLHPLTLWLSLIAIAVGVVLSSNVYCAMAAIALAAIIVKVFKQDGPWGKSFHWSIFAASYLLMVRLLTAILIGVPRPGRTLFTITQIHLPSWMPGIRIGGPVTLERIQSSLHEALIIATIILLFGAANSVTSPHKLLRILPVSLYQVGVALTIATSALPQFVTSITRIREAQFLRNGKKPRVISIAIPLLEESLSRAVHLAESMESRGFGLSRKRTRYRPILFTPRDGALISIAALIATVMVAQ